MERRFRNSVAASSCWMLSSDQILAAIVEDSLLNCNILAAIWELIRETLVYY